MRAVIFDLDGTLINSMYAWEKADFEFLKSMGITPDCEYKNKISTLTFTQGIDYIKKRYNLNMTSEKIAQKIYNIVYKYYKFDIELKYYVYDFINELHLKNIKMGIATSCISDMCVNILKKYDILKYFDAIVYSDDIKKNKSEPDIYIKTANMLETDIKDCVIFEDSLHAIIGAKKTDAFVVGVYDEYSDDNIECIKSLCDKYIYSFDEFKI